MDTVNTPKADQEVRDDRKAIARVLRQRKMLTLMDGGVASTAEDLELERSPRDLAEFMMRWLDGLTQALWLVEKRERLGPLPAGEQARLTLLGDRLERVHAIFDALPTVEAEIDAMDRAVLESWRPEDSANWPE